MVKAGATPAMPIRSLPDKVLLRDLPIDPGGEIVVGIASDDLEPFSLSPRGSFVVCGPPGSGRTTALLTIIEALRRSDPKRESHYIGNARSPVGALPGWVTRACSPDEVEAIGDGLAVKIAAGKPVVVVIESVTDFVGGPAEYVLQTVAKAALANDSFLVVEGETSTLGSSFGLLAQVKSSRAGLALQPDPSDGGSVFRTNFPSRINRAECPPGRALLVRGGGTSVVQIALPDMAG